MTVFYTVHAQKVMADRGVSADEVEVVVNHPEIVYRGNTDRPDCKVFQLGKLGVVAVPQKDGTTLVITVLWRHTTQWTDEEMRTKR